MHAAPLPYLLDARAKGGHHVGSRLGAHPGDEALEHEDQVCAFRVGVSWLGLNVVPRGGNPEDVQRLKSRNPGL